MNEQDTTGRCISCGFLAHEPYVAPASNRHQEVGPQYRENPGKLYRPHDPTIRQKRDHFGALSPTPYELDMRQSYLLCYLQKFDLRTEMAALIARPGSAKPWSAQTDTAATEVLNKDRGCPSYCAYVVGLSPKDHLMERRMLGLEADRQAFQGALERQNIALARQGRNLAVAALIVGALIGGAQVLTMTSESVLYRIGAAIYRHFVPLPPPVPQAPPAPLGGGI